MTTVQELEVTVTSHIDVCAVRYEAINARLKRLERILITGGGTAMHITNNNFLYSDYNFLYTTGPNLVRATGKIGRAHV